MTDTKAKVRAWLLDYAWGEDTEAEKEAVVDCIMAQDRWQYVSGVSEHFMGQRSGENPIEQDRELADGMALSALYECHDTPHLTTCPNYKPCLDAGPDCKGTVEYRMPLSGTGKSFPRCDKHWSDRLDVQQGINERYPSQPPADWSPYDAGESWDEEY